MNRKQLKVYLGILKYGANSHHDAISKLQIVALDSEKYAVATDGYRIIALRYNADDVPAGTNYYYETLERANY